MNERASAPAYPEPSQSYPARDGDYTIHETRGGLTIREHFAGLAMQAVMDHADYVNCGPESVADAALELADALIAALNQEQGK